MIYLFDVDGTLTPSRQPIDKEFLQFFLQFCDTNDVYLVTGSDRKKTVAQIGKKLYNKCKRVYNFSGNDVYEQDTNVFTTDWKIDEEMKDHLHVELYESKFPVRTGRHLEERPGCVNFSIVGRNAIMVEREEYVQWDKEHNERLGIAQRFNEKYSELEATVGGETGLDIAPKGNDKSQILKRYHSYDNITFFGDKTYETGNDYTLAHAIITNQCGKVYQVSNYQETWKILRSLSQATH